MEGNRGVGTLARAVTQYLANKPTWTAKDLREVMQLMVSEKSENDDHVFRNRMVFECVAPYLRQHRDKARDAAIEIQAEVEWSANKSAAAFIDSLLAT